MKKTLHIAAACLLAALPRAHADDAALRPIAYLSGVNQDSLAAETAELARTIDALMAELQRNGFPAQSLAELKQLVAQLGALGGEDMTAIAARLRGLGENTDLDAGDAVTAAYLAQQQIENRLKTLAQRIALRQLRQETVRRLEALIARQLAVQRETRAISAIARPGNRQQLLASDQGGVGEDLEAFFQTGETLLVALRDSTTPRATAAPSEAEPDATPGFAERINAPLLNTYVSEALAGIQGGRYNEAHARQNALLAELNRILQGILSSQSKEQRLSTALAQVSALREEQAAREENEKKPEPEDSEKAKADAEKKQAAADEAKLLAAKVAAIDPEAAKALAEAQKALQEQADEAAKKQAASEAGEPEKTAKTEPEKTAAKTSSLPEPGEIEPGEKQSGEKENQVASAEQPTPSEQAGEKQNGEESDPAAKPLPSEALAALAKAEAALRKELASTQAKDSAESEKQLAKDGSQQSQAQQPKDANTPQNTQQGSELTASVGGEGQGLVAHRPGDVDGPAQTVGALQREEREAMLTLQNERYPAEYSTWVQQYWRNLAQDQ